MKPRKVTRFIVEETFRSADTGQRQKTLKRAVNQYLTVKLRSCAVEDIPVGGEADTLRDLHTPE